MSLKVRSYFLCTVAKQVLLNIFRTTFKSSKILKAIKKKTSVRSKYFTDSKMFKFLENVFIY